MKRVIVLAALVVLGGISVMALQGPNVAEIQKVKDNLYMITGGGGNTAGPQQDQAANAQQRSGQTRKVDSLSHVHFLLCSEWVPGSEAENIPEAGVSGQGKSGRALVWCGWEQKIRGKGE